MSNQIVISSGAKVRSLNGVITGTTGVLDALPINAANGIPQLDLNGKILVSQLPNSVMEYQGTWNANTNTPTLTNGGAFNQGDVYLCNVAGTTDFGAGPIAFVVGDQVIYSGSIWQRASGSTGTVTSVAVTETGDALTITGSPITTSGTINVGFAGTSAQYVAGNGALVTFPDLTGYVTLTTNQTISGVKTFTNSNVFSGANLFTTWSQRFNQGIGILETANFGASLGYTNIVGAVNGLALRLADDGKKTFAFANATTNNTYTFPNASGTVALTSDLTGGTVTSVGLTMPVAFNVASSPITTSGTLAVTAAGFASQYIRGDGTLADFPSSGGGSSVSYYLNGGTSQGVIGGTTYYEMSKTADTGTGVDFPKTGDGLIVSFLTDANDPAQLTIPGGNWNYEIYVSMSSNGGTPQLYAELYKYDGTTFTLISTSANEIIYDGVNLNLYTFAMAVPTTTLTVTDRLAVKLYATNSGGKTTTVHTQNSHLCQVITTFSTGITALNGLTAQVQYLATGTSGTDFNISSATATHTFNLPTASAANRGALSSADWTTFNNKQSTLSLTTTGNSGSATLVSNTLNVPTYTLAGLGGISLTSLSATTPLSYNNTTGAFSIQVANTSQDGYLSSTDWNTFNNKQSTITNPVTGTGTSGQVTYFNGTSSVTSSSNFKFDGTNLTIGNPSSALAQLHVFNSSAAASFLLQTNSTTDYSEIAVRNNSSTATSYFRQYSTAATGSDFGISRAGLALFFSNYATNFAIGTRNGGDLIFGTADTERARMFSATGNLSLNSSSDAGYKFDVNGTGRFTGALNGTSATFSGAINLTGTANTFQVASIFRNANRVFFGGDTGGYFFQNSANTVTVLQIADSGAATFSSSVQTYRLKLVDSTSSTNFTLYTGVDNVNSIGFYNETTGVYNFKIGSTGAATFSSSVTATTGLFKVSADRNLAIKYDTNVTLSAQGDSGGPESLRVYADTFRLFTSTTAGGLTERFTIANTGAATFSSSVTANGYINNYLDQGALRLYNSSTAFAGGIGTGAWVEGSATTDIAIYSANNLKLYTGSSSTPKMTITAAGNVGIGTSSPDWLLKIEKNSSTGGIGTYPALVVNNPNAAGYSAMYFYNGATNVGGLEYNNSSTNLALNAYGALLFQTGSGTERMRITSGGTVCMGRTSSPSTAYKLAVQEAVMMAISTNGNNMVNFFNQSDTYVASIVVNASTVSYGTGSDYRLKEDLKDFNGLQKVSAIKVYDFKFKEEGDRMEGVIAHELQEIVPYAVTGVKDGKNNDGTDKIQNVDYSKIVPILVKAIQEQQKQIEELKLKIK